MESPIIQVRYKTVGYAVHPCGCVASDGLQCRLYFMDVEVFIQFEIWLSRVVAFSDAQGGICPGGTS